MASVLLLHGAAAFVTAPQVDRAFVLSDAVAEISNWLITDSEIVELVCSLATMTPGSESAKAERLAAEAYVSVLPPPLRKGMEAIHSSRSLPPLSSVSSAPATSFCEGGQREKAIALVVALTESTVNLLVPMGDDPAEADIASKAAKALIEGVFTPSHGGRALQGNNGKEAAQLIGAGLSTIVLQLALIRNPYLMKRFFAHATLSFAFTEVVALFGLSLSFSFLGN